MSHYRQPKLIQQFQDVHDFSEIFLNIEKSPFKNLKFSGPKVESSICSQLIRVVSAFSKFIVAKDNVECILKDIDITKHHDISTVSEL